MNRVEQRFSELVEKFKEQVKEAAEDAIGDIYGELLPYAVGDTESNAIIQAKSMASKILSGSFELDEDGYIRVDGWSVGYLSTCDYDALVDKLAEKCADVAAQKKIERLERQLAEAYRSL